MLKIGAEDTHLVEEATTSSGGYDDPAEVWAQGAQHAEQILVEELGDREVGGEGGRALAEMLVEENERSLLAVAAAVRQELLHGEVSSATSEFSVRRRGGEVVISPA